MIFAAPWVLLALPALPLLWWLLRVTPPAPRTETFPAIRLLTGLRPKEETPARTPWWLLLLRMAAAALVILALARPVLDSGDRLAGDGPVLVVLDDGWASSADWAQRQRAASAALDRAGSDGRKAALLTTAPAETGTPPVITPLMPVAELRPRVAALRPLPWGPDRSAAAKALAGWSQPGTAVVYVADGVGGAEDAAFARALSAAGNVTEIRADPPQARLLLPPRAEPDRLVAQIQALPQGVPTTGAVLAQSGDARTLARVEFTIPPGATEAEAPITLPPELRNRLTRLELEGAASAGSVTLLDERWRRRPVGLAAPEATADAPLTGSLFYLRRALQPYTELRTGNVDALLSREISVVALADEPLAEGDEQAKLTKWVEAGGLLIRFAGPRMAEATANAGTGGGQGGSLGGDKLLPVRLLAGDRQLGGALSWSKPAALAPFPEGSPFAGMTLPPDVSVSRQVLAEPSANLAAKTWAALADGTPLVTAESRGQGRIVLFHVTANADWSTLPLSGLFVDMLRRLVGLANGVAPLEDATLLRPAETLDGFGVLANPPRAATALAADAFARTSVSPEHPPGLYGPENGRRALNLGGGVPALRPAATVAGATEQTLGLVTRERAIGPWLLTAAVLLLAVDMLLSLVLRGLLRPALAGAALLALAAAAGLPAAPAWAQGTGGAGRGGLGLGAQAPGLQDPGRIRPGLPDASADGQNPAEAAALHTRLAYVVTGDATVDGVSKAGLAGLSDYVNRRTAASLADPAPVTPGVDDLSVYPLLYWPVTADAQPDARRTAALNDYMSHGGIILVDTKGAGGGGGFAPAAEALERVARGLEVPPLAPLTTDHVLARAFYLLNDFPGRLSGGEVWVQRDQDRTNDSVSPVIIGDNDWSAAWAVDASGRNPYAMVEGGARQRTMAYRFGVNLVMYALTGNYKGDQVHVPAILERLGQ